MPDKNERRLLIKLLGKSMSKIIFSLIAAFLSCSIKAGEIKVTEEERENLMEGAKLGIYRSNGEMQGYMIRESQDAQFKGSLLDRIGLKAGDIIIELNGHKINNPQSVRPVYEALKNENRLNFVVLRKPSNMPLFINAELLVLEKGEPNKSMQPTADASVD